MYIYADYMQNLSNYRWQLRNLNSKEAELRKIRIDINNGVAARDVVDEDWETALRREISELRDSLQSTESIVANIPETPALLPCKIFLRMHYIIGCSLTETAAEIGVSLSTLRRIRERCYEYFADLPRLK